LNALIGAYQEGRAEASMAARRRLSALQMRVLPMVGSWHPMRLLLRFGLPHKGAQRS
jgi:hypothetical protein